ncbi:centrosomal protein of 95 kDa-like [Mytilus californianus]|uniref:centrosomal protein of 95 kDa-like n=1 Tax=Mytilus californianus TaxID=6549 RepID=UPI0022469204|nr:centrosomal protein of 95 kDa-like [Mytilus californianus]XP_052084425.1 centrosomal protein of 95 kDa-like [Mytilus californianus]XP_052084432.1 centrosomal protein of 95 kDa-like [Mytilus californianus]
MGPKPAELSSEDRRIVSQANTLLEQLNAGSPIGCVEDINSQVYVTLFEGLCGEKLNGIIRTSVTTEDEIHNVQTVIDTLAADVLHTSLLHINGRDVVNSNRESVLNLLEILSGLLEYIFNKIESDLSTDNEEGEGLDDDPDALQRDMIDKILEKELNRTSDTITSSPERRDIKKSSVYWDEEPDVSRRSAKSGSETDDLIALGHESPTGLIDTITSISRGNDSTNELIREGENIERRMATRVTSVEEDIARHRRELGLNKREEHLPEPAVNRYYQTTVPQTASEEKDDLFRRRSRVDTYKTLDSMVEETAALARAAVDASPSRARSILQSLDNDYNQAKQLAQRARLASPEIEPVSTRRNPLLSDIPKGISPTKKPRSPVRMTEQEIVSDPDSPDRGKRKVSFMVDRSDSSPSFTAPNWRSGRPIKSSWDDSSSYTEHSKTAYKPQKTRKDYGSYLDYGSDRENLSYDDRLKKKFHEIIDDVLSEDERLPPRYKSRSDQHRVRSEKLVGKSKGTYNVVDAQKLLKKERETSKKKMDFLQKIYKEDLDEMALEADEGLDMDRKAAKQTENEYKKKVLISPQKKLAPKTKTAGASKKPAASKHMVSSKAKKKTSPGLIPPGKIQMHIKDDEDILPMLLTEFPHLHLSMHTWHELWRKGIHQIEQVTRANQEMRRKKSKAKTDLEEAQRRQEIMVNIMKKEIEHSQRMKEIQERQKQTVATRNGFHEQRMQSARSRKYYDDYQVRMRSKMMKRRTREEMIFRKLFKDGLEIQKDRIKDLRKYAKEQREKQATKQRNEVESLENYYRDQFDMLAENITSERKEIMVRDKAQQKVLEGMKKELRKKMEKEIKDLQSQLVRDDDDAYFRQLDADRVIHNLQMAKYHVTNV